MTASHTSSHPYGGTLPVLAAACLWGTVGPVQVWADSGADPVSLGAARLLIGGLVLAGVALLLPGSRAGLRSLARREVGPWIVAAALATAVYQAGFLCAVSRTGAALATAVALGVAPVATGVCARVVTGERLTAAWAVGTAAAVAGCVLLLGPGGGQSALGGVVLGIVSGVCYGLYTVAAKRLSDRGASMPAAVAATLLAGGVVLAPAVLRNPSGLATGSGPALLVWLGVVATAGAYMAFVAGLRRVTAGTAGTLSLAEPLVAAVLGLLVLGERLSAVAAAGMALLLAGLVAVSLPAGVLPGARQRATRAATMPTFAPAAPVAPDTPAAPDAPAAPVAPDALAAPAAPIASDAPVASDGEPRATDRPVEHS
ncbi:DMT family transporter [Streptomyces sp. NRRL S-1868]|uniref:DMT family transporter n=1 Tax=Streptomyces sp. NRRL S-1868 TaxID=1463892 RepID=UPI0007C7DA2B|nr:EamA family transporter [Streptomyces sp. NRRL S-1868]